MIPLDPTSFAVGVVTGAAAALIFGGFAAFLVAYAGADSADKRGLSGRHRREALRGGELPANPFAVLPAVAPQGSPVEQLLALTDQLAPLQAPNALTGLGSTTAAGRVTPSRPPRTKRPR